VRKLSLKGRVEKPQKAKVLKGKINLTPSFKTEKGKKKKTQKMTFDVLCRMVYS